MLDADYKGRLQGESFFIYLFICNIFICGIIAVENILIISFILTENTGMGHVKLK